ncbi:hypothetical protein Dimus_037174, partial [Dionaea muscipula]
RGMCPHELFHQPRSCSPLADALHRLPRSSVGGRVAVVRSGSHDVGCPPRSACSYAHPLLARGGALVMESRCSRRVAARQWKLRSLLVPSPLAATASCSRLLARTTLSLEEFTPLHEKAARDILCAREGGG